MPRKERHSSDTKLSAPMLKKMLNSDLGINNNTDSSTRIGNAKMDVDEFLEAAEIDDVFIQILLLRGRLSVSNMFKSNETTTAQERVEREIANALGPNATCSSSKKPSFPIASAVASMFGFNNKESSTVEIEQGEQPTHLEQQRDNLTQTP